MSDIEKRLSQKLRESIAYSMHTYLIACVDDLGISITDATSGCMVDVLTCASGLAKEMGVSKADFANLSGKVHDVTNVKTDQVEAEWDDFLVRPSGRKRGRDDDER